jgi:hypothetical protein
VLRIPDSCTMLITQMLPLLFVYRSLLRLLSADVGLNCTVQARRSAAVLLNAAVAAAEAQLYVH